MCDLPWEAIVPFLDATSAARVCCAVREAAPIVALVVRALETTLGLEVAAELPSLPAGGTALLRFLQAVTRHAQRLRTPHSE